MNGLKVDVPGEWHHRDLISCQAACPVHTDARGYVRAIADDSRPQAVCLRRVRARSPFSGRRAGLGRGLRSSRGGQRRRDGCPPPIETRWTSDARDRSACGDYRGGPGRPVGRARSCPARIRAGGVRERADAVPAGIRLRAGNKTPETAEVSADGEIRNSYIPSFCRSSASGWCRDAGSSPNEATARSLDSLTRGAVSARLATRLRLEFRPSQPRQCRDHRTKELVH